MHFLCVCYYDLDAFSKFGPAEFQKIGEICAPHDRALKESGKVRLIGSLGIPNEFKTLRAQGGAVQESDGPYADTKHPFGAFFLVEADNMDEAVKIARLHPGAHLGDLCGGGIEIRPISFLERL